MSQLKRLIVKNYRTLRDVDLELRPLNILIGANGSGKSNFLSLFELFRQAADEKLNAFINQLGGHEMIRTFQAVTSETIRFDLTFDTFVSNNLFDSDIQEPHYNVQFAGKSVNSYVFSETLDVKDPLRINPVILDVTLGSVRVARTLKHHAGNDTPAENAQNDGFENELFLSQFRLKADYPELFALRRELADWTVFRAFGDTALRNIHSAQLLNVVQPLRLNPDGSNLISVLYHLRETPRYEDAYERLMETMRLAFPDFDRFDIQVVGGGMVALSYRSKDAPGNSIPASLMSDGQLRFLGLALLLSLPEPPPLIAIDEPEIGLHPSLLPLLAALLKEASRRTQIIVATHSPQLLDAEDITADDVIIAERENGSTKLERLSSERLAKWLESYSLGEMWTRGTLDALRA